MHEISEIIYNLFCQQEIEKEITISKTKKISIKSEKLINNIEDISERLKIKLKTGKCSTLLIDQLALHQGQSGEKYGNRVEYYDSTQILELIESIENDKVQGELFQGDILGGYLHIHHSPFAGLGYSLLRNIKEYWFKNRKIRTERINGFENIVLKYGKDKLSAIAISMHQIAILEKDLKGEWLIYKIHNGIKYYLCLATHKEGISRKNTDEIIYNEKISKCLIEFPKLK